MRESEEQRHTSTPESLKSNVDPGVDIAGRVIRRGNTITSRSTMSRSVTFPKIVLPV